MSTRWDNVGSSSGFIQYIWLHHSLTALAEHILWQRMSCLHPFLLATVTVITSEKAVSRGGTFQKSLTLFSSTCLGCLNTTDSDSRHLTTWSLPNIYRNLQHHVSTSQSHNPYWVPISCSSPASSLYPPSRRTSESTRETAQGQGFKEAGETSSTHTLN